MTPSQIAHRLATTPDARARELRNIARAEAHVAMEDALHTYADAIRAASRQHADRLRARAQAPHRNVVQTIHDYEWARSLYWRATRDVNAAAAAAEALLPAPLTLGGEVA